MLCFFLTLGRFRTDFFCDSFIFKKNVNTESPIEKNSLSLVPYSHTVMPDPKLDANCLAPWLIDWLMLHSLLIYEIDPVQYPLHIKHMWNPQNEFSIASWLQWLHNLLYYYIYIYMRYDIVYSYTVYTIYIYISYINIQYMYTIYMYYMNHDMIYNRLHNIQYNIHALKIHLLCWPSLSCHGAEMTGFASCLWPWRLDRVGPRFQWCNVHVVSEIKTIVNDIHVILLYPSIP